MIKKYIILGFLFLFVFGFALEGVEYEVDKYHSSISFTITHMVVSKVRGNFNDFSVVLNEDPADVSKSTVTAVIKTAGINTGNEKRDNHLRSADFFDAEKYPEITFKSSKVVKDGDRLEVTGTFSMGGVSKEVTLPFTMAKITDASGKTRMGVEAITKLDRKEYGVKWNRALDKGGFVLGDTVYVEILLELKSK